ncbi:cytochrome P450 [Mycena pura]|uniref:Cytochrome P450 n=1 Tax=Mycena pura TaxID=153505 RepID=A0AAD6VNL8_9AGAR|nr:cytochrome P450 [Mycena pura]
MGPILLASIAVLTVYAVYRWWTRLSIADLPGPTADASFLLGNMPELIQSEAGDADFKWQKQFGHVMRLKGVLGTDRLFISDPKTLHYIYGTRGYDICKQRLRCEMVRIVTGPGLAWASDEVHRRQRRINSPAFGNSVARSYVPVFLAYANLSAQWKDLVAEKGAVVVNTPKYFSRFFLDVIGEVAFDYQFGATNNEEDIFAKVMASVVPIFMVPTNAMIFVTGLLEFLPMRVVRFLIDHGPTQSLRNGQRARAMATQISKNLVDQKSEALLAGKGKRDIMSLLVQANASANPETSLTQPEIWASMQTFTQAGHETTANTMSFALFELSRRPDIQTKLRAEVWKMDQEMRERGDIEFTATDFDNMPYTIAVMKEILRFHPVAFDNSHDVLVDDVVLPLSYPITTNSGKVITELPVPKGTVIQVSFAGYNRHPDVFGDDAHVFRPERYLDDTVKDTIKLGVYGNVLTFGSGVRTCIGWRFAVYEFQAFLVELVQNFEFSIDPEVESKFRRTASLVMIPSVSGEEHKGPQLPIMIKSIERS